MTPEEYAQAVRDAVGGHPDREELLEDLDDHLLEIAAESDVPLEDRLGPPSVYAEELMAAYGGRAESRQKRRARPREWALGAHATLLRQGPYQSFVAFLPELRPGWWVLRGYLLAMLLLSLSGEGRIVPGSLADWAVVAVAVWASVWLGRRRGGRPAGVLATALNAVSVLVLLAGLMAAESSSGPDSRPVAMVEPGPNVLLVGTGAKGVYNIKPYAKDGTPLTDVYLYDQDGNPLTTDPESYGYMVDRSCGEPILNRYPLPLVELKSEMAKKGRLKDGMPVPVPSSSGCPAATPSPTPTK
ncbi:hypothetical protein ETD86_14455 [Nonomuraea turkmeniaca]|uniref:Uncharacterized protein n=1 Tax=Nonomuraea turkmeniaca TaxID=103838 RepID=A0A5S4FM03_9ACTN|nr:hypothetical protein [Nonomuraea turkmeniaca]TMR21629.1 hypothetical protein ETD86_14455 [Nonomuraea turkmeniaca]